MSKKNASKRQARLRRKVRVRRRVTGSAERPRLTIFRSSKHVYAQVVDDSSGRTVASASSLEVALRAAEGTKCDLSARVGALIAERCVAASVKRVVFDRNGYIYDSGRVRTLAEAARAGGLEF